MQVRRSLFFSSFELRDFFGSIQGSHKGSEHGYYQSYIDVLNLFLCLKEGGGFNYKDKRRRVELSEVTKDVIMSLAKDNCMDAFNIHGLA